MEYIEYLESFLHVFFFGPDMELNLSSIIAAIIAAAASLAATGISAGVAAKQNKKNQEELDRAKLHSENEYLRDYYKGLDSTENRAYIKRLDSRMRRNDAAADNSSVATNATHENALATKQRNNEVYSDAISDMAARTARQGAAAKDSYFRRNYALTGQQVQLNNNSAANWMNAASGIAQAGTSLGMAYAANGGKLFGNKPGAGTADADILAQERKKQMEGLPE